MSSPILIYSNFVLVLVAILLKSLKLRRKGRSNTIILMISDLFLLLWSSISLTSLFTELPNEAQLLQIMSLLLAIPLLALFFEREIGLVKYDIVAPLLSGGAILIAYLQFELPDTAQLQLFQVLLVLNFVFLAYRWFEITTFQQELSNYYDLKFIQNKTTQYVFMVIMGILLSLATIFAFTSNNGLDSILYAGIFVVLALSLFLNDMTSKGLNQKIYAILYILKDNIQCYVEFGETKILDIENKVHIREEFAMALNGMSQMTSEMTKSGNQTAKLNYITTTDLFTEFYIIDESRYFVSIQDRRTSEILNQLVELATQVDDSTENDQFLNRVNSILGLTS